MTQQNMRKSGSEPNMPPRMPKQDKSLRWQQPQGQSDTQSNIDMVNQFFDFFNTNDLNKLSRCEDLCASNLQIHDPSAPSVTSGVQELEKGEKMFIKAFPNKKTRIETMVANDDKVVVRWTCTATHKGEFQGVAPTNKNVTFSGISIYRFANGKIAEVWQNWDLFGLLKQVK